MNRMIKFRPLLSYHEFRARFFENPRFKGRGPVVWMIKDDGGERLRFVREDYPGDFDWTIDLLKLYEAYRDLELFRMEDFKKYIPDRFSSCSKLLQHIGVIAMPLPMRIRIKNYYS